LLDDQVVKTQAMRASPYIGPFEDRVRTWEAKLSQTQVKPSSHGNCFQIIDIVISSECCGSSVDVLSCSTEHTGVSQTAAGY
jgi:hypothetical protein